MVLPMPPGPTTVTRRWRESRETSAATASSRPIMRVTANGRLCVVAGASRRRRRGPQWLLASHRGDEIVAPSWNGDDVAMAALAVAEGAAQRAHLDLEVRVFDEGFRPGSGDQFLLADHLAGAFDQSGQDVEGAAAEPHRLVALEQQPLRCKEPERPERDRLSVHGYGVGTIHLFTRFNLTSEPAGTKSAAEAPPHQRPSSRVVSDK